MQEYLNTSISPKKRAQLLKEMNPDEKTAQLTGVFAVKNAKERLAAFLSHGGRPARGHEFHGGRRRRGRHGNAENEAYPRLQPAG